MKYIDPHNYPQLAIRQYDVLGGSVIPDLFDGTIFRIASSASFSFDRLRNQIDGAKFFLEVYNPSANTIYVTFDSDYVTSDLGVVDIDKVDTEGVSYYELICRRGVMIVYDRRSVPPSPGDQLYNPKDGAVLINPVTGQPLLNPKQ